MKKFNILTGLLLLGFLSSFILINSDIQNSVDDFTIAVKENTKDFKQIVIIDHSRLAQEQGVKMPPSIVNIFSNPKVNSQLLSEDILIGLDLPYRVIVYAEPEANRPTVAYADKSYLQKRYSIDHHALNTLEHDYKKAIKHLPKEDISKVNTEGLTKHYGIIDITSDYNYEETIARLKKAILSQGDTRWFSDIDYKKEAEEYGVALPKSGLLLFGGPAPGGKAMNKFPKLGLDAFCQKILVYEAEDQKIHIAFNDIEAFAKLHYGTSAMPHQVINKRLTTTFTKAISK
ncbi:DUF302 domain-containing protein [Flammeovirga yaeyamensis]|uniref:DUF302 domain-containing protein n=1 Tax=Flammeovirga yaeyamensis TaxID=367791 RepID=A0AAX1NCY2_9BACT|nr:DUF302 domain-containing protein [Flammeovirga yaeyamensis]MBB3697277.1 uncharacterized protein (DUF302 family) [Flammeovirga yaeyamensis]NMF33934.1 DUF302 domain-containing protein [Flammeovirga yaeyamensis]QWG04806.1 DUF302 domain-containing protein [Flammeovirga yaeyamensis]